MSIPFRRNSDIGIACNAVQRQFAGGGLIAYPTETVYGLGSPLTDAGLDALNALKARDSAVPSIVLVSSMAMLSAWGFELWHGAERLARVFWPGPLTLVLPNRDSRLPERLRGASGGIGVRWTAHAGAAALVEALGHPLPSTSANLTGAPAAVDAGEVIGYFPDAVDSRRLLVLDGGPSERSLPSTVVDCTGPCKILREGAISRVELRPYLG